VAVTQQLARITAAQLARCRWSVHELDRVCSFAVAPALDHLDLDRSPAGLLRAARLTLDESDVAALRRALEGDEEVNPAFRDHPHTIWEHPVTALEPAAVAEVAGRLRRFDPGTAVVGPPPDDVPSVEYLREHLVALRAFYDGAADRGLATVMWWD
jgi:hypothetical protein